MAITQTNEEIVSLISENSTRFDYKKSDTAIILAAGHGKRIKSQTSKMLHKIWEKPTVERVYIACDSALTSSNIITVVGIKAEDVIKAVGKKDNNLFAYQEVQNGTGHAVQVALQSIDKENYDGIVYVFPGDMGLINSDTVKLFRESFLSSKCDMMVLTGLFEGNKEDNYYGRIIRVKEFDSNGKHSLDDFGKVIEIIEYKDILALSTDTPYKAEFGGRTYFYSKEELLAIPEFNSGVFAFDFKKLVKLIYNIKSENVQNEVYLTDLISLFNQEGYVVQAVSPLEQFVIMGFNNKSVLKEMEDIARTNIYEKLKDIITIDDPDDFYIDDEVIEQILELDDKGIPLDIQLGKGSYLGKGVKINYNLHLHKNVLLDGNITLGRNVDFKANVDISCYKGQKIVIGNDVTIFWNNILRGNIIIGENCRIESGVKITGSDEFPVIVGAGVTIKGISYIFGSKIDDGFLIEHSVLIKKEIKSENGEAKLIGYYIPETAGKELVKDLK
ncbi:multidrug transporter [bacterium BRH_c32]|nr:MAG: multidrug transporter [bacterium BRH_c32]